MNTITCLPYFLPCIISVMCAILLALKKRTPRQTVLMVAEILSAIYYLVYALYTQPNTDYYVMIWLDAWCIPVILALEALNVSYVYLLYAKKNYPREHLQLFAPALILGSVNGIIYYLIGIDEAAEVTRNFDATGILPDDKLFKLYHLFSDTLVNATSVVFAAVILVLCIRVLTRVGCRFGSISRFCIGKEEIPTTGLISALIIVLLLLLMPLVVLGRVFMMNHMFIGVTITILIALTKFMIYYVENVSDILPETSLQQLTNLDLRRDIKELNQHEETDDSCQDVRKPHASAFIDLIHERFHHLMTVEEIYKDENLTLGTLSERMGIGRTTLSAMIKIHYGIPFRELVNRHRIECAKSYMLAYPEATQETVSQMCGFKNGNYLNTKFKEIVGDTPMMWLAKASSQGQR